MRRSERPETARESGFRRRDLLLRTGLLGAAAVVPAPAATAVAAPARPERMRAFSAAETDLLNAVLARLIPTDENGPGATEARVGRYVDETISGDEQGMAPVILGGLAALDEYARTKTGAGFVGAPAAAQDQLLRDCETGVATGFPPPGSAAFFATIRELALEGMFGDPEQGGNAGFVGWDLLGYPGVKLSWSAKQQRDAKLKPSHKSAADFPLFKAGGTGAMHHGH